MAGTLEASRAGQRALVASAFLVAALIFGTGTAHAAYSASVKNGVLQVTGNGASDTLAIRLGSPTTIQLDVGEDGTADFTFDRSLFTAINVDAGGGDDEIVIDQSGGTFTDEAVTSDGGSGDDRLIGGDGADVLIGGGGDDFADGNRGSDTALLGSGNDHFQWDPGDGSDVVEGEGGGHDQLDFDGSNANERIEVSAKGPRVRFTRDIAAIVMDLDGIEHVHFRALGGTDTVIVDDLAGTDAETVDADLSSSVGGGDGAIDTVIANGTAGDDQVALANDGDALVTEGLAAQTRVSGGEPQDTLEVAGLAGNDTLTATTGVAGPMQASFDGGDDVDATHLDGTSADDQIAIFANGVAEAVNAPGGIVLNTLPSVESLVVSGLGGNDTIQGQNGIAALTPLTIDGGSGDDILGGGDGADLMLGGGGDDHVDSNRGTDTAVLGTGNDHFQWDPGDGSDVVEGQGGGKDQLDFNGSNANERIEVSANGPRARLTRDIAAINMDLDGIEQVAIRALGGVDTVTVDDLAGTAVDAVTADLSASIGGGDGAIDTVIANGTAGNDQAELANDAGALVVDGLAAQTRVAADGQEAQDTLQVAGLGGDDTLSAAVGVSGAMLATFDGGDDLDTTLFDGTPADDQIAVLPNAGAAAVSAPGTVLVNTLPSVESLVVSGLGGNDTIAGQNGLATLVTPVLTVDGGQGDDILGGGDGADLMLGGGGDDHVDSNRGTDTAVLGTGNDHFQWDPGDGSDVVEGQGGGKDQLDFNGSNANEQIEVAANGPRARLTRDIAAITMDFDGIEHVAIRALGGTDTITVDDLTGTNIDSVTADLSASVGGGDGALDTVVVNGTETKDVVDVTTDGSQVAVTGLHAEIRIAGSEPTDTLLVKTLGGDDTVNVDPGVSAVISPVVDLGPDE